MKEKLDVFFCDAPGCLKHTICEPGMDSPEESGWHFGTVQTPGLGVPAPWASCTYEHVPQALDEALRRAWALDE